MKNKKTLSLMFAVGLQISSLIHPGLVNTTIEEIEDKGLRSENDIIFDDLADNLKALSVREKAKKFIEARDAQLELFKKVSAELKPKELVSYSESSTTDLSPTNTVTTNTATINNAVTKTTKEISSIIAAIVKEALKFQVQAILDAVADSLKTLPVREKAKKFIESRDAKRVLFKKVSDGLKQKELVSSSESSLANTTTKTAAENLSITVKEAFKSSNHTMLDVVEDSLKALPVHEKARKFIEAREAQRTLFEKVSSGLKPKELVSFSNSSLAKTAAKNSSKSFNNRNYAVLGVAAAGLMSGVEYLYDKIYLQAEPAVDLLAVPAVYSDAKSTGYLAKAQDLFHNYASKEAVKNGVNTVVEGVKTHKEAAIGAAGLAAFVGVMKAFDHYNTPTSKDEQAPVVEQTSEVEQAPVIEPVVEQTSVVEPVVVQVPAKVPAKKFVKLTVVEIAQAQGANVQGVINELKAHGHTKVNVKASDLKKAGKLNDGQIRFIIASV